MNKVILMGRLVADPETRYGAQNNTAVVRFRIAVDRRFKREGQPEADFFNCTAFGKTGEFIEKYFRKGNRILVDGEIQNDNYTNKEGQTVYGMQIIVNNAEFTESKASAQQSAGSYTPPVGGPAPAPTADAGDGFMNIPDGIEDELPFN